VEGRAALDAFALDPATLHLNHGSYGACPNSVLAEQARLRARMEANPNRFFFEDYPPAVRAAAVIAADRFGGAAGEWVFVENATSAVNGVLDSLVLEAGDVLVTTSHAYGAVTKAMRRRAGQSGAEMRVAELPAPIDSEDQIVALVEKALCPRTKLLVVDHVSSPTATIFPAARIAALARAAGVPVFIDGAHAPGQLTLDVPGLEADWYTANAHKWLFAPRGCGLLWTAPARLGATHPSVTSHGWGGGYTVEFDWIGTRDVTAWLALGAACDAHDRFGGPRLMTRNRALAADAGEILAKRLRAVPSAPAAMRGAMTALRLPAKAHADAALSLRRRLSAEHGIEVPVFVFQDALWVRVSAQIYNEIVDYERLSDVLVDVLSVG